MINKLEELIIKNLSINCEQNKYSIVEMVDIKEYVNQFNKSVKKSDIKQALQSLSDKKIIDIKYCDDNVCCLLVLKSYEEVLDENKQNCISEQTNTTFKINYFIVFILMFLAVCLSNLILYFIIR